MVLSQLADGARRSPDLQSFVEHMLTSRPLRTAFDYLSGTVYGSPETAWRTLRGLEARWPDERELEDGNSALAGLLLEGAAPSLAAVGLGNLANDHLALFTRGWSRSREILRGCGWPAGGGYPACGAACVPGAGGRAGREDGGGLPRDAGFSWDRSPSSSLAPGPDRKGRFLLP
jgi:hypothetical protein